MCHNIILSNGNYDHTWRNGAFEPVFLTSGGLMLKASAILPYSSLTLVKPSILPVGLPCASCVWNTSLGRRSVGGGGSPAPFTADFPALPAPAWPPLTSSLSTKCSFVDLFFFLHGPSGIVTSFSCVFFLNSECNIFFLKSVSRCSHIEVPVDFQTRSSPYLLPYFLLAFLDWFPSFRLFHTPSHEHSSSSVSLCSVTGANVQQVDEECGINSGTEEKPG